MKAYISNRITYIGSIIYNISFGIYLYIKFAELIIIYYYIVSLIKVKNNMTFLYL
jgi:hypothetical protein